MVLPRFEVTVPFIYMYFSDAKKIQFRSEQQLETLLSSFTNVNHNKAGALCTVDDNLLYVDKSSDLCVLRWIKCQSEPEVLLDKKPIYSSQRNIMDTCLVESNGEKILVTADPLIGRGKQLSAYSFRQKKVLWGTPTKDYVNMQPRRLCTDNKGHIFVTDQANSCVVVLSADGGYLTTILKMGDHGIGKPDWIRWDPSRECLVLTHLKKNDPDTHVSVFKLKAHQSSGLYL